MQNQNLYAKTGAVFYILWGLLHLYVAYDEFGFAKHVESITVRARLDQLASYIGVAAVAVIVIAVVSNWRNRTLGYWLNLAIVSVLDVIYIAFVVVPTDMPPLEAWPGPILWIIATVASTIGFMMSRRGVRA